MTHKDRRIRIMLVDDHRFFRDGVRTVLQSVPQFEVVAEAATGEEAVQQAEACTPDVVLMDVQLPGLNGIEATRRILKLRPAAGVIVLTMHEDAEVVLSAMRAGARGYLLKDAGEEQLIRSIHAVADGEALFGAVAARSLMHYVTDVRADSAAMAFPDLTDREREILRLMARGASNEDIATQHSLSLKTVRNHVSSILSKMAVSSRSEAVLRAREAGLS